MTLPDDSSSPGWALWRGIINSLDGPPLETPKEDTIINIPVNTSNDILTPSLEPEVDAPHIFLVQVIKTEVYVYTDLHNNVYGESIFHDVDVLGEFNERDLTKMLNRRTKRRQKKPGS